jgi:hypothetical protein
MGVKAEASIITALDDVVGSVPNTHAAAFCCTLPITWAWASIIPLGQRYIITVLPTTMIDDDGNSNALPHTANGTPSLLPTPVVGRCARTAFELAQTTNIAVPPTTNTMFRCANDQVVSSFSSS